MNEDVVERVSELLRRTRLNPREWRQYAIFRRGRYTRNIVGYSPNQFIALLLCWERGQQSSIHDHAGAHCFVKMLAGQLKEERFAWGGRRDVGIAPDVISEGFVDASNEDNSVCFMHDSIGLHRISNPSSEDVAVSLHIYSPPFSDCLVFPPTGAPPRVAPMVSINSPIDPPRTKGRSYGTDPPSIHDLCNSLLQLSSRSSSGFLDPDKVLNLLTAVELSSLEWASYASMAQFSEFHAVQNLIHCDDEFSVLIACFSPGQKVPPHTLGRGRKTWVKVLHGELSYEEYDAGVFPWESDTPRQSHMEEGSCSVLEECSVRMHTFANASSSAPAVSVHIFSPPLTQFTFHTEKGVERLDVPALLGASPACGCRDASGGQVSMRGLMRIAGRWFLSFRGLTALLDEEIARGGLSQDVVTSLLRKAVFNPEEWRDCLAARLPMDSTGDAVLESTSAPRRILLAHRDGYSLVLSFWGHNGHAHCKFEEPASASWTLILEGELEERSFPVIAADDATAAPSATDVTSPTRTCTLKEESITFYGGQTDRVRRCCDSDLPCVSLHLYSPALPLSSDASPVVL
jgi:cysteine dioxygenase